MRSSCLPSTLAEIVFSGEDYLLQRHGQLLFQILYLGNTRSLFPSLLSISLRLQTKFPNFPSPTLWFRSKMLWIFLLFHQNLLFSHYVLQLALIGFIISCPNISFFFFVRESKIVSGWNPIGGNPKGFWINGGVLGCGGNRRSQGHGGCREGGPSVGPPMSQFPKSHQATQLTIQLGSPFSPYQLRRFLPLSHLSL